MLQRRSSQPLIQGGKLASEPFDWGSRKVTVNVTQQANYAFTLQKFLDAGIQDVSTSISIVHDLIEMSPQVGDESDKHI